MRSRLDLANTRPKGSAVSDDRASIFQSIDRKLSNLIYWTGFPPKLQIHSQDALFVGASTRFWAVKSFPAAARKERLVRAQFLEAKQLEKKWFILIYLFVSNNCEQFCCKNSTMPSMKRFASSEQMVPVRSAFNLFLFRAWITKVVEACFVLIEKLH